MTPNAEDLDPTDHSQGTDAAGAAGSDPPSPSKADLRDPAGVERRALLPEEETAGSDDPEAQADAILEESQHRQRDRSGTADEHRRSEDVVDPPD